MNIDPNQLNQVANQIGFGGSRREEEVVKVVVQEVPKIIEQIVEGAPQLIESILKIFVR